MNLELNNRQDIIKIDDNIIKLLNKITIETFKEESIDDCYEISLSFVSDQEIKSLNKTYRNKDKSTDVLSFPMDVYEGMEEKLLGDIIISTETLIRQSEEYNHSLERELGFLYLHGLLHLLGYDHIEASDRELMEGKQSKIINNIIKR